MVWNPKDPGDEADYSRDVTLDPGDSIASCSWTVLTETDPPLEIEATKTGVGFSGARIFVWFKKGTGVVGTTYEIQSVIDTALGRTFNRKTKLKVKDL